MNLSITVIRQTTNRIMKQGNYIQRQFKPNKNTLFSYKAETHFIQNREAAFKL